MKIHGDIYDYSVRQWCLDLAVKSNKRNGKAHKIVQDASLFYGFMFPENGELIELKQESNKNEKRK